MSSNDDNFIFFIIVFFVIIHGSVDLFFLIEIGRESIEEKNGKSSQLKPFTVRLNQ